MPSQHAFLSASSSSKWLNCPVSAKLESTFPNTDTIYTQEGTLAHSICEEKLKKWKSKGRKKIECSDKEMDEATTDYKDYVVSIYNSHNNPELLIEERLDYSRWVPSGFGTGDALIVSDAGLDVIDFKYGKGVPVDPEENSQLMLYAAGAIDLLGSFYDFERVTLHIFQPRIQNVASWETTKTAILDWLETIVVPAAQKAMTGEGEACAGAHCRFCKARSTCKARAAQMEEIAAYRRRHLLSQKEISLLLNELDPIQAWAKELQDEALRQALEGAEFEGWKVVEGTSRRTISDKESLVQKLLAEGYEENKLYKPKELLGIGGLEKMCGKKRFAELAEVYIDKPRGKPVLVPITDKRPVYSDAVEDFSDMIKGGE
ncbi:DUF2800 domain-containing protein [Dubosiella newyorkensis]|uniref:Nuclease n=1 Tax=Dubosiella newyorkensis TaxID=1862672 RepID=A0A1U7NMU3_9FIRM|nr:DUF2800 domain-containing protein [Dubosiella newyorkensis]OLU46612.1 hypothetical protein BO225_05425 [Dubosiella newyorkensis]